MEPDEYRYSRARDVRGPMLFKGRLWDHDIKNKAVLLNASPWVTFVTKAMASDNHAGELWGHTRPDAPVSTTVRFVAGGSGARKRRLWTGGAAYRMFEKL
ncbi:hypothetical protein N0V92_005770 [Colletotrichum tropicale]|nr:hypothetical protein N0V92_005770 [Colletotrichum tropicale]